MKTKLEVLLNEVKRIEVTTDGVVAYSYVKVVRLPDMCDRNNFLLVEHRINSFNNTGFSVGDSITTHTVDDVVQNDAVRISIEEANLRHMVVRNKVCGWLLEREKERKQQEAEDAARRRLEDLEAVSICITRSEADMSNDLKRVDANRACQEFVDEYAYGAVLDPIGYCKEKIAEELK